MKKIIPLFLLMFALFQSVKMQSQDIMKSTDLSTIKVDNLSENDIAEIKSQLIANKQTIEQVMPMVLSKGMTAAEFIKLKLRLGASTVKVNETTTGTDTDRKQEAVVNIKEKDNQNSLIFGSQLFDNPTLNFEPNLKIASPVNYVLGPGDELQVSVFGVQEYNATVVVSVEGKVSIQNVGQFSVSGMTFEAATTKIKSAIAKVYSTVASGQSQVGISLSRIRTIKITLIGSKQPGNYSISSLATVYNALFLGGGPGNNETYRNIELLRNNKVIKIVDIYNFLVNGSQEDNLGLKDNDVIRIPAYKLRVILEGEVKRPGIFEMKDGETFDDLLRFASGFNDLAYKASVNVIQKTDKEFKVKDIKSSEFKNYIPKSGDVFKVSKILNRFENRISIDGAVFRPDTYSFNEGMRILDLVSKADGLKEDAYTNRAAIIRVKPDLTSEIVNVDLAKAINGDAEANILLKKEDRVTVYSILEFKEDYNVTIDGEISNPGVYHYFENLTLNDLLIQAGGLTGSASKRVEVARMIKSEEIDDTNPKKVELINIEISASNNEQAKNFALQPFDVINIRKVAVYEKPEMVTVSGAVNYAGNYVLANKKDKIYDVIQRAGGLTSLANIDGVKIRRPIDTKQIEKIKNINLKLDKKDSIQNRVINKLALDLKYATIPVNWKEVEKNQESNTNVTLFPGDIIEVSTFREGVKVAGNVLLTSEIPYDKSKGFGYYINAVGGVDNQGWQRKSYIIYPNGEAAVSKSFLFLRFNPKVKPDSQIIVPQKPERRKLSTVEFISIGSILASLSLIFVTAFK
ncbi:SLBB domain-containing protein [Flavobacterium paronense]|uniref:SLBB domain-containing protein n=1 Tax=Flavobacterium paronense TaxID=1392775 RepID=A0ABV5GGX7_9FLAO|nr:SLBB domain-containing protein [Flavobacterium paronense]MDN3676049.1 SLBB domain-containing protein [Flavobacterium paronense]